MEYTTNLNIKQEKSWEDMNYSIYVACLSSYNSGILYGKWIDVDQSEEDIREEIQKMLDSSPMKKYEFCEEYAIHDYCLNGVEISEYESIESICDIVETMEYFNENYTLDLFTEMYNYCNDLQEVKNLIDDKFIGCYDSISDYVYEHCHECYEMNKIPSFIQNHIDYDSMAKDFELSGDIISFSTEYNKVYIFYNN